MLAAPLAVAQTSAYKTPASGAWKIQDRFEYTDGGSATVANGGKRLTKLTVNVGTANQTESRCGEIKRVAISKSMPITRVGSYKRPVVGRLGKDKLITSSSTTLDVDGAKVKGTVQVVFEKTGRQAFTAELIAGDCELSFAIRK